MRSLVAVLPDVIDELRGAVPEYIQAKNDGTYLIPALERLGSRANGTAPVEWISVKVLQATLNIVARTSNRVFVGLTMCKSASRLLVF